MKCNKPEFEKYHVATEDLTKEELAAGLLVTLMQYCFYLAHGENDKAADTFVNMFGVAQNNQDKILEFVKDHTRCPDCKAKMDIGLMSHN